MGSLWALGDALAAFGLEVTHGEQRIKSGRRELEELHQAALDALVECLAPSVLQVPNHDPPPCKP